MNREYPFTAFAGQEKAKRALLAALINPGVSGCLLTGETGSGKSVLAAGLKALFPEKEFSYIPLSISEENLAGDADLQELVKGRVKRRKGLLEAPPGTVIIADDMNLFRDSIAAALTQAWDTARTRNESLVFIGMMNPKEGLLPPGLLSRFGLCVSLKTVTDPDVRIRIMKNRIAWENRDPAFLREAEKQTEELRQRLEKARKLLPEICVPEEMMILAADIVRTAGCEGNRAEILLVETARSLAALDGLLQPGKKQVTEAASLVLPHRMGKTLPDEPEQPETASGNGPEEAAEDLSGTNDPPPEAENDFPPSGNREDMPEEADPVSDDGLPDTDMLMLPKAKERRRKYTAPGKRNRTAAEMKHGHMVRSRQKEDGELALADTLKTAAVRQKGRKKPEGLTLAVLPEDFRRQVKEGRTGATVIFLVDASGSMGAKRRMRAVKSAVLGLLKDAYQNRDKAGIVCFRGSGAQVLLYPTRSLDLARRKLARLPVGGKTPLAEGLITACRLLEEERLKQKEVLQYLVLLTDGRANAAANGRDAKEAALEAAAHIAGMGIHCLVLDTENPYVSLGFARETADALGAEYASLPFLNGEEIQRRTKGFMEGNRP